MIAFTIEIQFKNGVAFEVQVSASNKKMAEEKAKAEATSFGFNQPIKKTITRIKK